MRCTKNCNAYSQHWSTKGPSSSPWQHPTTSASKLNKLCYELLSHWPYSPELLPTDYHFFKHLNNFLQGKRFHKPAGGRKCFWRVCQILKHIFSCYRNKYTYCSLAKVVLIVMVPILINNDAFEPSYNDLKFTTLIKPQLCLCQPNNNPLKYRKL